jgi:nucleotide-binding universal stress UspA family protein
MPTESHDNELSRRIVVGIDGSLPSRAALAWAGRQAVLTAAPLTVVTTWAYPTSAGFMVTWPENIDFEADARSELEKAVEDVLGPDPGIEVTTSVIEGVPSLVLVEESKAAALIVVGSRGHGAFAGMLLGSVSEFLATHAHCPVVIIRDGSSTPEGS